VLIGGSQVAMQRDYKLQVTPTHCLLDAAGKVVFHHAGYKSEDEAVLQKKVRTASEVTPPTSGATEGGAKLD
jgi:hypothetical protein